MTSRRNNHRPYARLAEHRPSCARWRRSRTGCCGWRPRSSITPTRFARTSSGVKVGGHQASSASMVSIMTALWFEHLRGRGSGFGQAARLAGAARDRVSARPAGRRVPDDAAPVRRLAELSEPAQGSGAGRLLDRVGRDRRDGADLERDRPPLRGRPLRRSARRPAGRAARRRRARRGRDLGGARRPGRPAPRRGAVDRRPQPPVA